MAQPWTAILSLSLALSLSGCLVVGGDAVQCPFSECAHARCDGTTVEWCRCGEDGDGPNSDLARTDCAEANTTCVVIDDGSGGAAPEAVCMDVCTTEGQRECRAQTDGSGLEFECAQFDPSTDSPFPQHVDRNQDPVHASSIYQGFYSWRETNVSCTP